MTITRSFVTREHWVIAVEKPRKECAVVYNLLLELAESIYGIWQQERQCS